MIDLKELETAMKELDEDRVMEFLNQIMGEGGSQAMDAMNACARGMNGVGSLFEEGEYFVGDLIYAGELMIQAVETIKPAISSESASNCGKMILCTVEGDLHDIGKNIVRTMLEASGFEVLDLGIDVAPEKIIETARKENISIIALSGVLTLAIDSMKKTVDAFAAAGMRDQVKIIVGGSPVTEAVCNEVGADAWATNPQTTVNICQGWL